MVSFQTFDIVKKTHIVCSDTRLLSTVVGHTVIGGDTRFSPLCEYAEQFICKGCKPSLGSG